VGGATVERLLPGARSPPGDFRVQWRTRIVQDCTGFYSGPARGADKGPLGMFGCALTVGVARSAPDDRKGAGVSCHARREGRRGPVSARSVRDRRGVGRHAPRRGWRSQQAGGLGEARPAARGAGFAVYRRSISGAPARASVGRGPRRHDVAAVSERWHAICVARLHGADGTGWVRARSRFPPAQPGAGKLGPRLDRVRAPPVAWLVHSLLGQVQQRPPRWAPGPNARGPAIRGGELVKPCRGPGKSACLSELIRPHYRAVLVGLAGREAGLAGGGGRGQRPRRRMQGVFSGPLQRGQGQGKGGRSVPI